MELLGHTVSVLSYLCLGRGSLSLAYSRIHESPAQRCYDDVLSLIFLGWGRPVLHPQMVPSLAGLMGLRGQPSGLPKAGWNGA